MGQSRTAATQGNGQPVIKTSRAQFHYAATLSRRHYESSYLHSNSQKDALRLIAVFEGSKGVAALAALVGIVDLLHHDIQHVCVELIGHFGLDPTAHVPSVLLHYADTLRTSNLGLVIALASGYSLLRFLEAYGLWYQTAWGEYVGAISGGLYVPFEVTHVLRHPNLIGIGVLLLNTGLVAYLVMVIRRRQRSAASQ